MGSSILCLYQKHQHVRRLWLVQAADKPCLLCGPLRNSVWSFEFPASRLASHAHFLQHLGLASSPHLVQMRGPLNRAQGACPPRGFLQEAPMGCWCLSCSVSFWTLWCLCGRAVGTGRHSGGRGREVEPAAAWGAVGQAPPVSQRPLGLGGLGEYRWRCPWWQRQVWA